MSWPVPDGSPLLARCLPGRTGMLPKIYLGAYIVTLLLKQLFCPLKWYALEFLHADWLLHT